MALKNFEAWSHENTVNFYSSQRCRVEDIYDSEADGLSAEQTRVPYLLDEVEHAIGGITKNLGGEWSGMALGDLAGSSVDNVEKLLGKPVKTG